MLQRSAPRTTQFHFPITTLLLAFLTFASCTGEKPATSMDQMSALQRFTLTIEKKYKREALQNDIDLHFIPLDSKRVKIVITYKDNTHQSMAESVAEAAVEHYRRLAREAPEMNEIEYVIEKEVKLRPKSPNGDTFL